MQDAGLPEPEYKQSEFMLYAALKNKTWGLENSSWESLTGDNPDRGQAETSGQANKTSGQANKTSAVLLKTAQNKQRILNYLAENGEAGTKVLADILSLSQDRARVILTEMIKEGTVVAVGKTNTRVYRLAVDR
jgi:predicted HTH transcriptional regulator